MQCILGLVFIMSALAQAALGSQTHEYNFTTGWVRRNPDGMHEKQMIGFNGVWPPPDIHLNKGDRLILRLTNGFENLTTSLHFHGLSHNITQGNLNQMDGPEMVTQCPIMPGDTFVYNFTVPDQAGTFWYHSHSGAQYTDGMRGALIIHDDDEPFEYDEEMVIQVTDLYHKPYYQALDEFLTRYNPTGAEPVPENILFNNTVNASISFEPGKVYLLRFLNVGTFVSQYIFMEDHEFTIVEVDGVYVQPNTTDVLYLGTGQRTSVLVRAKPDAKKNYALMQTMDQTMLDVILPNLQVNRTNQVVYNKSAPAANEYFIDSYDVATNDFYLSPLSGKPLFPEPDYRVKLDVVMDNLGDGVNYAFFNNVTYVHPKIPTLVTAMTAPKDLVKNPLIYGDNINAFVLEHGEIVEIVLNNYDDGRHPFHLHGHNFQIVQKSPSFLEDTENGPAEPVPYNESAPLMDFPESPMLRDTVVLEGNGHLVLRFVADNPGVWIFHCHVDWHLEQGLAAVFIEAPDVLRQVEQLNDNFKQVCYNANIPTVGNAAGNTDDWFDLAGLPKQPEPLPDGFTLKGYIAFAVSSMVAVWGLYTIVQYGLHEATQDDELIYSTLKNLLEESEQSSG
ncbi:ferroxidase FET5 [Lachancea thermotolerans CBS 6340]|uniref:KLTH0G18964p n=1 Tax=Lachancea thermotolerans (strain ATCC 56472 / CBS 6340 / NRRL Y-8284) TaxID=559295 RepID=C5DNQ3_LACTC|nr:KLTH0G18964p [Lachancea thermotolerans CBS 6340]CAR25414.1 KLTH0G18964p [Lachancea thermotolerans CBS 6340]